jgi:hypothetical protein
MRLRSDNSFKPTLHRRVGHVLALRDLSSATPLRGGLTLASGAALDNLANVVSAIERFDSWSTPWMFHSDISASSDLNDADRKWFEKVWSVACNPETWSSTDSLVMGIAAIETTLSERFPILSGLACRQLARAASYQWR